MENNKKIKPNSYYSIQYWMVNELGLKGLELSIYAIIGSLTLAHSQNSQMSFMYGFFFVKFLFYTVVCVVIVI